MWKCRSIALAATITITATAAAACSTYGTDTTTSDAGTTDSTTALDAGSLATSDADTDVVTSNPSVPIDATYAGSCLTQIAKDVAKTLRFYTQIKFVPGSASLNATMTPLLAYEQGTDGGKQRPLQFLATQKRGDSVSTSTLVVNRRFTWNLGTIQIPGDANTTLEGTPATVESVVMDGLFSADDLHFCVRLSGQVTKPFAFSLTASDNVCLFQRANEGDSFPNPNASDFTCAF